MTPGEDGYLDVNNYDEIPYDDRPYHLTHVRRLETLAVLHGMEPAPITGCRVLELGAARGGNLIPQALDLPGAHFTGMDLSLRQIEAGRQMIESLELLNIEMRHANILDLDDSWGSFDYIIAHGVYSWTPPEVRDAVLRACRDLLRPHGVAIITYNTYPGWRMRQVARDLIRFHAEPFDDPREQLEQGRAILDFMGEVTNKNRAYGRFYEEESDMLREADAPGYFYHEYLESHNSPLYFLDFVRHAEKNELQFVCEANIRTSHLTNYPEKVRTQLEEAPVLHREQYIDFVQNRSFRSSVLCHKKVRLQRNHSTRCVARMNVSLTQDLRVGGGGVQSPSPTRFLAAKHGAFTVSHIPSKRAVAYLMQCAPRPVDFKTLCQVAFSQAPSDGGEYGTADVDQIAATMMGAFALGIADFTVHAPTDVEASSDRPIASPLARLQAETAGWVTNLRHQALTLDDVSMHVVRRLDGLHDRQEIASHLQRSMQEGELTVHAGDRLIDASDDDAVRRIVDYVVEGLSKLSLIVA